MLSKTIIEDQDYVSFENGKWTYLYCNGLLNVYRHKEFHRLASKPEITMFYKILDLENSKQIEYDCDGKRVK